MREQLIRYIDLLFAGAPDAEEIKQEILQNTLDRYDDLVAQGKAPEAAYRLAISGIGDINEILGNTELTEPTVDPGKQFKPAHRERPMWKKILIAIAVFLYIISIIPLIILSELGMDVIGLCGTISIVAVATVAIIVAGGKDKTVKEPEPAETPQDELHKAVNTAITTIGLIVYFALSFSTGAWWITWLVFPIMAAVRGLVNACMDLKEASDHEN